MLAYVMNANFQVLRVYNVAKFFTISLSLLRALQKTNRKLLKSNTF